MHNEYIVEYEILDTARRIVSTSETVKAVHLAEAMTKSEDLMVGRLTLDPRVREVSKPRVRLLRINSWK